MSGAEITVRHQLRPGDLGAVVHFHGVIYAREYGFDRTFEAYVAGPLAEFARTESARERLWIAERGDQVVACIAIVAATERQAQLRWFLVHPEARGSGLGTRLLSEALEFSQQQEYDSIMLWTVSACTDAARLYRKVGFSIVEQHAARQWGVDVVEEKYELVFQAGALSPSEA